MQAVIETGGKQYTVATGDTLEIERLAAEEGGSVVFDRVLALHATDDLRIGTPTVPSARVTADVLRHSKASKVTAFKMKRRKGYRRTRGHRQDQTVVRITAIEA